MRIHFIDNIPLEDGVMGYGVTTSGTSAYFAVADSEGVTLMELNVEAIDAIYHPPKEIKERREKWLTESE